MATVVDGLVSIENLAHFSCPHCKAWWSKGDAVLPKAYYCPDCGKQSMFTISKPEHTPETRDHEKVSPI